MVAVTAFWFGTAALFAQSGADVIAHEGVKTSTLDKAALKDILVGKTAYWEGGQAVVIVVLAEKTDAALQDLTGMSASQFRTHWQRLAFSGRGKQPKEADSIDKLLALVADNKGAVALIPAGTALKGVKKIELK
jgi:hypothetical protein